MPGAVLAAVGSVVGAVHAAWVHGGARSAAGDGPAGRGPWRPVRDAVLTSGAAAGVVATRGKHRPYSEPRPLSLTQQAQRTACGKEAPDNLKFACDGLNYHCFT